MLARGSTTNQLDSSDEKLDSIEHSHLMMIISNQHVDCLFQQLEDSSLLYWIRWYSIEQFFFVQIKFKRSLTYEWYRKRTNEFQMKTFSWMRKFFFHSFKWFVRARNGTRVVTRYKHNEVFLSSRWIMTIDSVFMSHRRTTNIIWIIYSHYKQSLDIVK